MSSNRFALLQHARRVEMQIFSNFPLGDISTAVPLPLRSDGVAARRKTLGAVWLFEILAGARYATGMLTLFWLLSGAVHPDSAAGSVDNVRG